MNGLDGFLTSLIEKTAAVEEPGDFRRNGLLHCGQCGMPKQCKIELEGVAMTVGCMCQCAERAYEAERKAVQAREAAMRVEELRVQCFQDRAMRNYVFDRAEDTANIVKCRKYVRNWPEMRKNNCGLLLAGPPGTGKTFAAACVANALISRGVPVLVTSFPKILNGGGWDKAALAAQMNAFDLLVIDDLGTERSSRGTLNGYALEIVQMVVDERYKSQKPLIVTTNLSRQQLEHPECVEYARVFDRLEEMCTPVFFGGPSLRHAAAQEKRRLVQDALA